MEFKIITERIQRGDEGLCDCGAGIEAGTVSYVVAERIHGVAIGFQCCSRECAEKDMARMVAQEARLRAEDAEWWRKPQAARMQGVAQ